MPRAFFVHKMMAPGLMEWADGTKILSQPDFDVKTEAFIMGFKAFIPDPSVGKAHIIEDRRNRVVIETENQGDGWLVLSDNYYPGWQATIDGKPAEIFRANHTMRAVKVPAGRHVLSFRFAPRALLWSIYLSLAAAVVVVAALILLQVRRRKNV
jgi:uncharacterized membrane protein YfhO